MRVLSKKYDGSLRAENQAKHFVHSGNVVEVFSRPGDPFFYHKANELRHNENGLIELFLAEAWYNVMHIFKHITHDYAMYINLCMPAQIEADQLTWVDMDLDYRVGLDGRIELIDEDEFEENSRIWAYPDELIKRVEEEAEKLPAMIRKGSYPFNYKEQEARYEEWVDRSKKE